MAGKYVDETGNRYGKLVAIRKTGSKNGAVWLFQCDCGNTIEKRIAYVRYGSTRSCGCGMGTKGKVYHKDLTGKKFGRLMVTEFLGKDKDCHYRYRVKCSCGTEFIELGYFLTSGRITMCQRCANSTHRMSKTKLYRKWMGMKMRCLNKNSPAYKDYGGRGITICEEWLDPVKFFDWAYEHGYNENQDGWECSIDRKDVNKGYFPDNCRFVNKKVQMRNQRRTRYVEYEGMKLSIAEAAEVTGISYCAIQHRLNSGWNDYDATHIQNAKGKNGYTAQYFNQKRLQEEKENAQKD